METLHVTTLEVTLEVAQGVVPEIKMRMMTLERSQIYSSLKKSGTPISLFRIACYLESSLKR